MRAAPPGVVLRQPVARGHQGGRGRRRVRVLLPGRSTPAKGKPVLGAGEFVAAFADRPEVQAVQTYLASPRVPPTSGPSWATGCRPTRAWTSPTSSNPIDKLSVEILQDPTTVVPLRRFRPDARRGRRGHVLEGHGRLDQRQGHQDDARLHRERPGPSRSDDGPRSGPATAHAAPPEHRSSWPIDSGGPSRPDATSPTRQPKISSSSAAIGVAGVRARSVAALLAARSTVRPDAAHEQRGPRDRSAASSAPPLLLLAIGLVIPAIRTILLSFYERRQHASSSGSTTTGWIVHPARDPARVLLNTLAWVVLVPPLATAVGLLYAVLVDRAAVRVGSPSR